MNENKKRLLERIQKLLNLAKGNTNEHEAFEAAKKAHALLQEYNLNVQDLERLGEEEIIQKEYDLCRGNIPTYISDLCAYLGKAFNVVCLLRRQRFSNGKHKACISIVGFECDVIVCCDLFVFLHEYVENAYKKLEKRLHKASFCGGFAYSVGQRLCAHIEEIPQGQEDGLVLFKVGRVHDFVKNIIKPGKGIKRKVEIDREIFIQGEKEGQKVNLDRPISGDTVLALT